MNIEKIKRDGEIEALRRKIDYLHFNLTNINWDNIKRNGKFMRLGEAIDNAEIMLKQMREILISLQEMEPENK